MNPSHSSSPHAAATIVEITATVEIAAIAVTAQHVVPKVIAQRAPMVIVVPVAKERHLPALVPERELEQEQEREQEQEQERVWAGV